MKCALMLVATSVLGCGGSSDSSVSGNPLSMSLRVVDAISATVPTETQENGDRGSFVVLTTFPNACAAFSAGTVPNGSQMLVLGMHTLDATTRHFTGAATTSFVVSSAFGGGNSSTGVVEVVAYDPSCQLTNAFASMGSISVSAVESASLPSGEKVSG